MYNLMQRWEDESDEFHLIMSFARRANAVKLIVHTSKRTSGTSMSKGTCTRRSALPLVDTR